MILRDDQRAAERVTVAYATHPARSQRRQPMPAVTFKPAAPGTPRSRSRGRHLAVPGGAIRRCRNPQVNNGLQCRSSARMPDGFRFPETTPMSGNR